MGTVDRDNPPTFPDRSKPGVRASYAAAYPMGGVKTAPAWRAMWHALCDAGGQWVRGMELDEIGADAGRCSPKTAKLLLHRAAQQGVIEKDKTIVASRWQVRYRIPEARDDA